MDTDGYGREGLLSFIGVTMVDWGRWGSTEDRQSAKGFVFSESLATDSLFLSLRMCNVFLAVLREF